MKTDSELAIELKRFISGMIAFPFVGIVSSVDEEQCVAVVQYNDLEYDVRLRSVISDATGMILIPAVDSMVFCISEGNSQEQYIMVAASKVDKVIARTGERSLVLDGKEGLITFNDARLESFMTDINKLVDKINTIEQDINDLKQVFTQWIPAAMDGGAALKNGVTDWAAASITETTVDDIKDETIKN